MNCYLFSDSPPDIFYKAWCPVWLGNNLKASPDPGSPMRPVRRFAS